MEGIEKLDRADEKALMYFAGITAMIERAQKNKNITPNGKLTSDAEETLFAMNFFTITSLTACESNVSKTILKAKEVSLKDEAHMSDKEIQKYIDKFNKYYKEIAELYIDIDKRGINDDEEFQKVMIEEFSTHLIKSLNIKDNVNVREALEENLLKSVELGFKFK